jgi:hypothetical protein
MWWTSVTLGLLAGLINWPIQEKPVSRLATAEAGPVNARITQ